MPLVAPAVVGVKVTETEHVEFGATGLPQVLAEMPKALLLEVIEEITRSWLPVLVTVRVWGAEVEPTVVVGKAKLEALNETAGPAGTPVPERATV